MVGGHALVQVEGRQKFRLSSRPATHHSLTVTRDRPSIAPGVFQQTANTRGNWLRHRRQRAGVHGSSLNHQGIPCRAVPKNGDPCAAMAMGTSAHCHPFGRRRRNADLLIGVLRQRFNPHRSGARRSGAVRGCAHGDRTEVHRLKRFGLFRMMTKSHQPAHKIRMSEMITAIAFNTLAC